MTTSMTVEEITSEAKENAYRLVELLRALSERHADMPNMHHTAKHIELKAREIEYFLSEFP